jgi:hypothetical protein
MSTKISYEVVYLPDAEAKGLDLPCDSPDYGYGLYLLTEIPLHRDHSYLVAADNGEPEDKTFTRDFEPVVKELNRLAEVRNDLLAAAQAALAFFDERWPGMDFEIPGQIRTAIQKATGGTP